MSSKVTRDMLFETTQNVLTYSNETKKRKFAETVELQVVLKNFDPSRDKRFSGTVRLRHIPKPKFTVCVLGDERHCDEARANNIPAMTIDDLKKLNKDKKLIRKLAHQYDAFLASDVVIRQIPRIVGPGLNKAGKFPTSITHGDSLVQKVEEIKSTIKFQAKKTICLAVALGNVNMSVEELAANINLSVNFLVSLLKKNWQNIVYSSMNTYRRHSGTSNSDVEYNDDSNEEEPRTAPPLAYKRQVSFQSAQQNNLNEKSSTFARSISSPAKANRRRIRSISRSLDEHVSFRGRQTIYTAGRPAWYEASGEIKEAFVIGICGGSASGKTTVAQHIVEKLNVPWVTLLSMDSFYKVLTEEQHEQANMNNYNFDHPDAFDFDLLIETLKNLKIGKQVEIPLYNFTSHSRESYTKMLYGANVVIFEGIMSFFSIEIRDILDMKVFVDTDADIRLARRLERDITERGRDIEGVIQQYTRFVKPSYDHYIAPTMTYADIIVPRGGENEIAIDLIVCHVNRELQKRGVKVRNELVHHVDLMSHLPMPETFYIVEQTAQIKYLHTIIRNKDTDRDEFIFYSKRLMRILIEYALSLLPFDDVTVETPQNLIYTGKKHVYAEICGVSIIRAGECLEPALIEVYKDAKIGKILIQTNPMTGEPELHYLRLPRDIARAYVLILDATIATGAAALMAIRVLLDHNVPEEKIALLSLLVSKQGVQTIAYVFPKVKIVTTACDTQLDLTSGFICPGLGNFGDRYFGTDLTGYTSDADDLGLIANGNMNSQPSTPDSPLSGRTRFPNNYS
ncbi:unnamed protein product [Rotaria socialis]|uniref:Uridine kinase n=2 Tax=Rotaria socialis TaxID=392032 RepID=A0A820DZL2_9BILA|nr:unnamed protein product [Rotaria socialis]